MQTEIGLKNNIGLGVIAFAVRDYLCVEALNSAESRQMSGTGGVANPTWLISHHVIDKARTNPARRRGLKLP